MTSGRLTVIAVNQMVSRIFSFPHPVNEVAARWVAAMVSVLVLSIILMDQHWLIFLLAYGFLARVLTGPKLTPIGLIATRVLVPMFGNRQKLVAGPPKRFAQSVGLVFSVAALVCSYGLGLAWLAELVLGVLLAFAALEAMLGFCAGCFAFGYLIKWGVIPEETCRRCSEFRA